MALGLVALLAAALAQPVQAGGTLRRSLGANVGTLDPAKAFLVAELALAGDLFEGLVTVDAAGKPVPGVASGFTLAEDRVTLTFTLRPEARFSDGSPVTAEDVVFSLRRLVDPATAAPYAFFGWVIRGGKDVSTGRLPPDALGVRVDGPGRVVLTLERPRPEAIAILGVPVFGVVSRANLERHGKDFTRPGNLVSSGSFVLREATPKAAYRLTRNPHWHGPVEPSLDAVDWLPLEDPHTELKLFRAGQLDIMQTMPVSEARVAAEKHGPMLRRFPMYTPVFLAFNATREPWKSDKGLQRALSLAIDREELAGKVIGAGNRSLYSFVPGGVGAPVDYVPPLPADWRGTQAERDARAKALLAVAGYGPGGKPLPTVEITYTKSREDDHRTAIAIAAMWKQKLGVPTRLTNHDDITVYAMMQRKAYADVVIGGWPADYADPTALLGLFRAEAGESNPSGWTDPRYDALLDRSGLAADAAGRWALLAEAESLLLEGGGIVPLLHQSANILVAPRVQGRIESYNYPVPTRFLGLADR